MSPIKNQPSKDRIDTVLILQHIFPLLLGIESHKPNSVLEKFTPAILVKIRESRLAPLMFFEMARQGWEAQLNPEILNALRQDYIIATNKGAQEQQEIVQVLTFLAADGITPILLKGADLRLRLFGDAAVRPMLDLDLLISITQLSRAVGVMERLHYILSPISANPLPGYRDRFASELTFTPPSNNILMTDIHWELWAVNGLYRLPYHLLESRAILINCHGSTVKILAPEHALIHLCLHAFTDFHNYMWPFLDLFNIVDIVALINGQSLDWDLFLEELSLFRCQAPVNHVLQEINHLIPHIIPLTVLEKMEVYRPSPIEKLVLARRLRYLTKCFATLYHYSLRDLIFFLRANLWPDSGFLIAHFRNPDRLAYLKYLLQKIYSYF